MTKIRWIGDPVAQGYRIYRSDTHFKNDNLPPVLAELGPDVEEYIDHDGVDGENWYIVSAFIAGYEAFSEPFIGGLTTAFIHDIFGDGSAVATYRFDGDASDLGGNYDGTWSGTEQYTDGLIRRAASFSSNDDAVITPAMPLSGISLWWRKDGFEVDRFLFQLDSGDRIYLNNNFTLDGSFSNSFLDGVSYSSSDLIPLDGKWHHFYTEVPLHNTRIYIGREKEVVSGRRRSLGGDIDQFRVFNRALTEQEVQILYQEGAMFL